ncbi:MAG: hypothetical protein ACM3ML_05905 [Micromonosporaceae bacterium]
MGEPRVGDSGGTEGRRACSAGECSSGPSMTQVQTLRLLPSRANTANTPGAAEASIHDVAWS